MLAVVTWNVVPVDAPDTVGPGPLPVDRVFVAHRAGTTSSILAILGNRGRGGHRLPADPHAAAVDAARTPGEPALAYGLMLAATGAIIVLFEAPDRGGLLRHRPAARDRRSKYALVGSASGHWRRRRAWSWAALALVVIDRRGDALQAYCSGVPGRLARPSAAQAAYQEYCTSARRGRDDAWSPRSDGWVGTGS